MQKRKMSIIISRFSFVFFIDMSIYIMYNSCEKNSARLKRKARCKSERNSHCRNSRNALFSSTVKTLSGIRRAAAERPGYYNYSGSILPRYYYRALVLRLPFRLRYRQNRRKRDFFAPFSKKINAKGA